MVNCSVYFLEKNTRDCYTPRSICLSTTIILIRSPPSQESYKIRQTICSNHVLLIFSFYCFCVTYYLSLSKIPSASQVSNMFNLLKPIWFWFISEIWSENFEKTFATKSNKSQRMVGQMAQVPLMVKTKADDIGTSMSWQLVAKTQNFDICVPTNM